MAIQLFGFKLSKAEDSKKDASDIPSFAPPPNEDGSYEVAPGGSYGTFVDLEGTVRTELELVTRYRDLALQAEVESAIDDIVNEAIIHEKNKPLVQINLDNIEMPDRVKDKIREEFKTVTKLLDFQNMGYDIFRRWYIDGRIYYHMMINENRPRDGLQELRYIDPRRIRKVREAMRKDPQAASRPLPIVPAYNEYYLYSPGNVANPMAAGANPATMNMGIKISKDSVVYVTSGLLDQRNRMVLSHLHKAIKPMNQLRMLEDATVIYRLSRAPERRIFYIDVGNLPKMKAEQYLKDMMTKHKNKLVYDAATGEVRDDRKYMCFAMGTRIPLMDGRTLTLQDIITEYEAGKNNWVYSCDPITGKFSPGPVSWAGITKRNSEVVRVTFDNGESVVCTPDHKFPVWSKGFVEAKDLLGESIIPGYRRMKSITPDGVEYEQIFKNDTKTWEFTHRETVKWKKEHNIHENLIHDEKYRDMDKSVIHHMNFNRMDNNPKNLVSMNHKDHMVYHHDIQSLVYTSDIYTFVNECAKSLMKTTDIVKKINSDRTIIASWSLANTGRHVKNKNIDQLIFTIKDLARVVKAAGCASWKEYCSQYDTRIRENNGRIKRGSTVKGTNEWKSLLRQRAENREYIHAETWKIISPEGDIEIIENLSKFCREHPAHLNRSNIKGNGSRGYRAEKLHNHKAVSVEWLSDNIDVGCLTIDKDETYHSNHTYLLDCGVYAKNTMLEDFWLPRREGGRGTEITTLPGGQNLGEMDDVEYFRRKVYKSLNVPQTRIQSDASFNMGRSGEITRDEIKFSKLIDRLRGRFTHLFDTVLETQLVLRGVMSKEEWKLIKENVHYDFLRDNYYAELKEQEIVNARLGILQNIDIYVGKYFSLQYVRENVLQMTEEDIIKIEQEIADEEDMNVAAQQDMSQDGQQPQSQPQPQQSPAFQKKAPTPKKPSAVREQIEIKEKIDISDEEKKLIESMTRFMDSMAGDSSLIKDSMDDTEVLEDYKE